ncbi:MAG: N-acetylmuramic acid 6-phosphate etherase [Candidatus Palauibacterales bacterium]|nr:N-acetylmuramic acid 6-phosphate etherase [Candidatus Palauibacterales bacterium]MDP2529644.1 N-acetylmuramic acid 6-phosphate etherase [Candidatus Palauibacterales bacterium]
MPSERQSPTEAMNPRTTGIDRAGTAEIVRLIQAEDRLVPDAVEAEAASITALIDEVAGRLASGGRLVYVGAGTSGRLGVLDAAECPPTFGTEPGLVLGLIAGGADALRRSREGAEDDEGAGREDVRGAGVGPTDFVLGIASSGTTPYVRAALEEAASLGAGTGFLSCTPPAESMRRVADHLVTPIVGPEVVAGSTRMKAGTATKLVLNTLSTGVMVRLGKVYGNLMVDLRAGSRKLVRRALGILESVCGVAGSDARTLLVRAGGSVKTAIAMHELGVDRAVAERVLDACGGHLSRAVERFAGADHVPCYACYPEELGEGEAEVLARKLASGPERVRSACEEHAAATGPERPAVGWTPAQHVAHLLQSEREAYRPRIEALAASETESAGEAPSLDFPDWTPDPEPPGGDRSVAELLLVFAAERARTVRVLEQAPRSAWHARGTVDGDRLRLHQLARAMVQHDAAHAERIRERIHPELRD